MTAGNYFFCFRAYGVMIWEILTFGQQPLPDMSTQDIIDAAQNGHLQHTRYMHACSSYSVLSIGTAILINIDVKFFSLMPSL